MRSAHRHETNRTKQFRLAPPVALLPGPRWPVYHFLQPPIGLSRESHTDILIYNAKKRHQAAVVESSLWFVSTRLKFSLLSRSTVPIWNAHMREGFLKPMSTRSTAERSPVGICHSMQVELGESVRASLKVDVAHRTASLGSLNKPSAASSTFFESLDRRSSNNN